MRTGTRICTICFMLITGIIMSGIHYNSLLYANMRAPYHREYKESGAIKYIEGVTLKSEELFFDFDKYFTGDAGKVSEEYIFCSVTAVYIADSPIETEAVFSFISPSGESASAEINGKSSPVKITELHRSYESSRKAWAAFHKDLYSIQFRGRLTSGENRITVKYRQPLGVDEISHGYFSRSRWATGLIYEFSPIKEWNRAGDFRADIEVSVPYKWGVKDYLKGPDIELEVSGFDSGYKKTSPPEGGKLIKKKGVLIRRFSFTGTLPDRLSVSVTEK